MLAAARLVLQCVRWKLHDSGAEVLARRLCQCVCKRAMLCCVCFFHVALAGRFLSLLRRMSSPVSQLEVRQLQRRMRGNRSCHHKQKNNPTRSAASCQYGEVLVVSVFSLMIPVWGAAHRGAGRGRTANHPLRLCTGNVLQHTTRNSPPL